MRRGGFPTLGYLNNGKTPRRQTISQTSSFGKSRVFDIFAMVSTPSGEGSNGIEVPPIGGCHSINSGCRQVQTEVLSLDG